MNYMYPNNTGTNRDRSELFVAAVRTASGDTVPVHMSIIPSAQKWVFDTIYKLAFPYLYSSNICKMNRMVLTDEDESEYRPFQSAIATMDEFKHSKVMLCTFHGIWQSFKKDIYPLLDKCEHGEVLGKIAQLIILQQMFIHINTHSPFLLSGEWVYKLFMHQACVYENKSQYVKSHSTLTDVIAKVYADGLITQQLKEAIERYQVKMSTKEDFLAYYIRRTVIMSYDAMTTSPVESVNNHTKHHAKV